MNADLRTALAEAIRLLEREAAQRRMSIEGGAEELTAKAQLLSEKMVVMISGVLMDPESHARRAAFRYVPECSVGAKCEDCGTRRTDFIEGWMARHERRSRGTTMGQVSPTGEQMRVMNWNEISIDEQIAAHQSSLNKMEREYCERSGIDWSEEELNRFAMSRAILKSLQSMRDQQRARP